MPPLLYAELVDWYRLVDPPADHADQSKQHAALLAQAIAGSAKTLLELGAGAGHNGLHMKQWFACTLTDLSEPMQALSKQLNPDCAHVLGDMRTMRLERTFDAVLVHDAIAYMATRADLEAAARTAFVHTRPGGAAIFEPDALRDTFVEGIEHEGSSEGTRSVEFSMWSWDPDPADDACRVDFTFLLRHGTVMRAVHDVHLEGLFTRAVWLEVLRGVGFTAEAAVRPLEGGGTQEYFLCKRP